MWIVEMDDESRETQIPIAASSVFPGFKFSPTDEELVSYYLKKKLEGSDKCVEVISEVEINRYEPWDLPAKSVIQSENEWFFFSPRGRKYPNGSQNKRATKSGYWKATGKERNVKSASNVIGSKRTLVFHIGRAPKGERTEWIMHEFCMSGTPQDSLVICRLRRNNDFRLNDSPRQGSSNRRRLSTENDSNFGLSKVVDQSGVFGGAIAVECILKESSSNNSHSAEQQSESGSESACKQTNEFSEPGSSQQGCYDDDCYADILNDDIVDLGKSLLPPILEKWEDERSQPPVQAVSSRALPLQGTANRRIRLSMKEVVKHHPELVEVEITDRIYVEQSGFRIAKWSRNLFLSLLSERRIDRRAMSILLVFFTLLVLFLGFLGAPGKSKGLNMLPSF